MTQLQQVDPKTLKYLLKASWAAAFPSVVPFVLLVSFNAVDLLSWTGLGRLGIGALLVISVSLAFLFWKGRFWAAVPAAVGLGGAMIYFLLSLFRIANKYLAANPGHYMDLFMMCSPHLVIIVISLTLLIVIYKGAKISWRVGPQPLKKVFMGLLVLWAVALLGDAWYQASGWRQFNLPGDLMVRMCQEDDELRQDVQERLYNLGPEVIPDLLLGVSTPDPDLGCLRQNSARVVLAFGKQATGPLISAARQGDQGAVRLLGELGDKRALEPLRQLQQELKPDSPQELKLALGEAVKQLSK